MVLDGRSIVEKNIVTFSDKYIFDTEQQIQPNGVDLRLAAVTSVEGRAILPREQKMQYGELRGTKMQFKEGWVELRRGSQYLVDFHEYITVPDGYCAIIITRSSLLRSGIQVTSALWDCGFRGQLGGSLRPLNDIRIEFGARLAQVLLLKADFNGHRYTGQYQGAKSQGVKLNV